VADIESALVGACIVATLHDPGSAHHGFVETGLPYVDPSSLIQMANGAYLDTQNNILHESDGTEIDATTGLKISTTA
jgi:hypothetical protein